jgi:hypothetical protein
MKRGQDLHIRLVMAEKRHAAYYLIRSSSSVKHLPRQYSADTTSLIYLKMILIEQMKKNCTNY